MRPGEGRKRLRAGQWYRVKTSGQYCRLLHIPSCTEPGVSVPAADENARGFELALEWYTPSSGDALQWTKRVIIMELKKGLALLQEPAPADRAVLASLKKVAAALPVSSASRDGELTWKL